MSYVHGIHGFIRSMSEQWTTTDATMDPYVNVRLQPLGLLRRTGTVNDGGTNPVFGNGEAKDNLLRFPLPKKMDTSTSAELKLVFEAFDEDFGVDDLVGMAMVKIGTDKSLRRDFKKGIKDIMNTNRLEKVTSVAGSASEKLRAASDLMTGISAKSSGLAKRVSNIKKTLHSSSGSFSASSTSDSIKEDGVAGEAGTEEEAAEERGPSQPTELPEPSLPGVKPTELPPLDASERPPLPEIEASSAAAAEAAEVSTAPAGAGETSAAPQAVLESTGSSSTYQAVERKNTFRSATIVPVEEVTNEHTVDLFDRNRVTFCGVLTYRIKLVLSGQEEDAVEWMAESNLQEFMHDDLLGATLVVEIRRGNDLRDMEQESDESGASYEVAGAAFACLVVYIGLGMLYFKLVEDWSILDCAYFSIVTASTVGYGDHDGYKYRATEVFVIFYMLIGVTLVGSAINILVNTVMDKQEEMMNTAVESGKAKSLTKNISYRGCYYTLAALVLVLVAGAWVFTYTEDWHYMDSLYMCITTMLTVGYGDFSPASQSGKVVGIFVIILSYVLFGKLLSDVMDTSMKKRQAKMAQKLLTAKPGAGGQSALAMFKTMDGDGDGKISEAEYLMLMLVKLGKATQDEMTEITDRFKALDADGSGFLEKEDFQDDLA